MTLCTLNSKPAGDSRTQIAHQAYERLTRVLLRQICTLLSVVHDLRVGKDARSRIASQTRRRREARLRSAALTGDKVFVGSIRTVSWLDAAPLPLRLRL